MADEQPNPYREWSDDLLITRASHTGASQGAMVGEIMRRLKVAVEEQSAASNALAGRIEKLTVRLLWVTLVIGALTAAQVIIAFRGLR